MLPGGRNRKLVERPENEPGYDKNNATDRRLVRMFVAIGSVVFLLLVAVLLLIVFLR